MTWHRKNQPVTFAWWLSWTLNSIKFSWPMNHCRMQWWLWHASKGKKRQSYLTCRQQLSFFFALWVASLHQFPNDAFDLWHRLLPVGIAWVWRCSTFHLHIQAHTELPRPQIVTPMSKDLSGRWHRWHGWPRPLWPWLIHGAGRCC